MKSAAMAFRYLKAYPFLACIVLVSILIASLFEGASFGMLIPLIQSMTSVSANLFNKIPFSRYLGFSFSDLSQSSAVAFVFIALFLLLSVKNLFIYLSEVVTARLRFGIIRDLRTGLMGNLLEYDTKYFDHTKSGHIINIINFETERIGLFIQAILYFAALSGKIAVYILILCAIAWKTSIAIFVLITTVLIPLEIIIGKGKKLGALVSQRTSEYNHKLSEILQGMKLIRTCGAEQAERQDFTSKAGQVYETLYRSAKYLRLLIPLSETLIFGTILLSFIAYIKIVNVDISNVFPFAATYIVVLARMLTQLNNLNNQRSIAINNLAACYAYDNCNDKKDKKTIKNGSRKIENFTTGIDFKNVGFSYKRDFKVLNNINICIPRGKTTSFVGASGAGKSTIVNLISRFYDVDSGEILIDGIDLRDIVLKNWRKKIGFVSQDVFIFNTDIKSNISYSHPAIDKDKIIEAAIAANAHGFIMDLPDKYETILGERGVRLSGGQKQRISIARAIINNPDVLILDEATSSLDTNTEKMITDAISRLSKDRTVIAIAHRLSTILRADNIIVMDKGEVVGQGTHDELIKTSGTYKKLYDAQFKV